MDIMVWYGAQLEGDPLGGVSPRTDAAQTHIIRAVVPESRQLAAAVGEADISGKGVFCLALQLVLHLRCTFQPRAGERRIVVADAVERNDWLGTWCHVTSSAEVHIGTIVAGTVVRIVVTIEIVTV